MLAKTVRVALLLGVGMFLFSSLALAGAKTIKLDRDTILPDGQTLKAGQYSVVVDQKLDQVEFIQNGDVVVKHACKCIPQEKKNDSDAIMFSEETPHKRVLDGMRFRGETRLITLPS
ncbi:MAG TPA: hypothetical protein VG028_07605 [Terriglobia bacterium]|nr:hypothetical protein [Terriglobia bacterium]